MRFFAAPALLLMLVSPSLASMQIILNGTTPVLEDPIPGNNDFISFLGTGGLGYQQIVMGDVGFTQAGTLTFYAHASESSFTNTFKINGLPSFTELSDIAWNSPITEIGTIAVTTLDTLFSLGAEFTTSHAGNGGVNAKIKQDAGFGIFANKSGTATITGPYTTLYFGYDDNGATPDDDNHDDLIISAVFAPLLGPPPGIPEPVSGVVWASLCGLSVLMTGRRVKF